MSQLAFSNVFHVTVGGRPLNTTLAKLLVEGWVDLGAGVPGAFQLTFRDPRKKVLSQAGITIGTPVVVAAVADGQGAASPLLTGEVTGLEADYDGTGTFTVVRGYDRGHRMLRQRRVAAYREMTASDIARKLAVLDKIPIGSVNTTPTVYKFITQANVTDWDFLSRLADENERVLSLSPTGKLQFVRPTPASGAPSPRTDGERSPYVLQAGTDILRCRVAVTAAEQVSMVTVRGWDVTTKKPLISQATAASAPGISIGTTPDRAAAAFGSCELVETDTPYDQQDQVKHATDALADDVTGCFCEVEVMVRGNPKLRPGVPVALTDVGDPFEGKYTVTAARHSFGAGTHYETWVTVSGRQWRSLYGLASGSSNSGGHSTPRLPGVANAIVTDIKDPQRQGRVKLRFPWLDDVYVSDWTRTVQFGGVRGGGVIAPDVGDEVLVAFDRGALDHPYVIGGLYNGVDLPGAGDVPLYDGTSGKSVRHTLADRDGNRLDLLDQRSGGRKRGVRLSTGDDRLTVNLDRTGTTITVDSKGSVTIKGSTSVSVEAGDNLALKAGGAMSLRSGGALSIDAMDINARSTVFTVNSTGLLALNAMGMASVSGEADVQITSVANIGINAVNVELAGNVTANGMEVV
ncbi:MAG: VgrG-related protein [Streptomycetaceae bacterium]|nr:VgrG-related protein [Streptomycetaceae bacterium]